MNNNHLYRQEYIRLLWVHSQQISSQSTKANEQRRALKLHQKRKIRSLGKVSGLLQRAYLTIKHFSEIRELNCAIEQNQARLLQAQQEEIKKLKSSWEMHTAPAH